MKIFSLLTICILINLSNSQLLSQISLPYYSGFDNATQQTGWVEYKTASVQASSWGYGSANAYSVPNSLGHDYSPSTGITLVDNWFVSPGFQISNGVQIDSIRYRFSGFSTPEADDTIAVYLINGSQDPSLATSKTLLFDFRGTEYIADNIYRKKTGINLPLLGGLSYLAIRYRNSDCSSKWLTVNFDNIAISDGTAGISEGNLSEIEIFPNPFNGKFTINSHSKIESIQILNAIGQTVYQSFDPITGNSTEINLCKPSGTYTIRIQHKSNVTTQKIIIQ